jgi:predicted DNA-binding transcriptional regulator AlpA
MTARRDDLAGLPFWPRLLSREQAAAYVGVSPSTFDHEVRAGTWPAPMKRGRRPTWDRAQIDRVLDIRAGLVTESPSTEDINQAIRSWQPRSKSATSKRVA